MEQSEEEAIKLIFKTLQLSKFAKWPLNRRFDIAEALIPEYVVRQPHAWEIIVGCIVYLLCLALPVYFLGLGAIIPL